jgi:hypothetical protein
MNLKATDQACGDIQNKTIKSKNFNPITGLTTLQISYNMMDKKRDKGCQRKTKLVKTCGITLLTGVMKTGPSEKKIGTIFFVPISEI